MKKIGLFLCTFVATTALGAVSDKELKLSSPNGIRPLYSGRNRWCRIPVNCVTK